MEIVHSTTFACIIFVVLALICPHIRSQSIAEETETAGCGKFVHWVRGGNYVDNTNLAEGGHELDTYGRGYPFYICRAEHDGNLYIGKFIKSDPETKETPSQCWFTDGTKEYVHDSPAGYDVLVDNSSATIQKSLGWEDPQKYDDGQLGAPLEAFGAGQDKDGKTLYIGQCTIKFRSASTIIPGSIVGGIGDTMHAAFNNESPACKVDKFLNCLSYTLEK